MGTLALSRRFDEVIGQAEAVEATKKYVDSQYFAGNRIDSNLFLNWKVKARHLISLACKPESEHYRSFVTAEVPVIYRNEYEEFGQLLSILRAAEEDYKGGYMSTYRSLVQAEVFDSELEQARELLSAGYFPAAAVIAGTVLETTLRQLCADAGIAATKLDRMNADLGKAGSYNMLVQKRITALAAIRNSAAHGDNDQFTRADVEEMIRYIESFVADRL